MNAELERINSEHTRGIAALKSQQSAELEHIKSDCTLHIAALKSQQTQELKAATNNLRVELVQQFETEQQAERLRLKAEAEVFWIEQLQQFQNEQAKIEAHMPNHELVITELRAENIGLNSALGKAKAETTSTQRSMSKSFQTIRMASASIEDLKRNHAKEKTALERLATPESTRVVLVSMQSTTFKQAPKYSIRRCDTVQCLAEKLVKEKHRKKHMVDDLAYGVRCKMCRYWGNPLIRQINDLSVTLQQISPQGRNLYCTNLTDL